MDSCESREETLLHVAAVEENVGNVRLLLEHGANADASGELHLCPPYQACVKRQQDVVELLVKRGVDVEIAVQDALRVDNHDTVDKLQPLKKEKIIEGHDSNWRLSPRVVVPLESSMTAKGLSYCDATHRGNN